MEMNLAKLKDEICESIRIEFAKLLKLYAGCFRIKGCTVIVSNDVRKIIWISLQNYRNIYKVMGMIFTKL